jgi:hypothetical protein
MMKRDLKSGDEKNFQRPEKGHMPGKNFKK